MKFSIRQLLILTVALAILVATFTGLFKLKHTRVQIASEQQQIAESQTLIKHEEAVLKDVDGAILMRTIERDILKRVADPEKNQRHLDSIRGRMASEFKPPNDQITFIQLPSVEGWSYLINVPEGWNAKLNFGTNESPSGSSHFKQVKPPYKQFSQHTLTAGVSTLDVRLSDRENSDEHDLAVILDQTKIVDFVWKFDSKGSSTVSSSKPNGHIAIDRQLLGYGQLLIECNGRSKENDRSVSWKIWLSDGKDDSAAPEDK